MRLRVSFGAGAATRRHMGVSLAAWLRRGLVLACSALWLVPCLRNGLHAQTANTNAPTPNRLQPVPADPSAGNADRRFTPPLSPDVTSSAVQTSPVDAGGQQHLRIDASLSQSLARTGCAVHVHSNSAIPFAEVLNLPAGPYKKVYGTQSGMRHFGIVGEDCDHFANPTAPLVRMILLHRMDTGLIYVVLFNTTGEVLAVLDETPGNPPRYATPKAADIEAIYGDFKSETQAWNNALLKLLQNQTQHEAQSSGNGPR